MPSRAATRGRVTVRFDAEKARRLAWAAFDARMRAIGAQIKAIAQALVPVDTGYLRSTIYFRYRADRHILEVGASAYYAYFQEKGTSYIDPQPYLGPAIERVKLVAGATVRAIFASEAAGESLPISK